VTHQTERRRIRDLAATDRGRALIVTGAVLLIVVHGLWPEKFEVDTVTVALVALIVTVVLLPLLESASLPGGGGFVFRDKLDKLGKAAEMVADEIAKADQDDPDNDQDETNAAQRDVQRLAADEVVGEVLEVAARSPKLALMLISSELERAIHHLLMGSGWGAGRRRWALRDGVARLVELGVLPASAKPAADLLTQVRNAVVHGARPRSEDEVLRALDSGIEIYNAVANVPRERNFVFATDVPIFSDEDATQPITDAKGVMLRTVSPGARRTESRRIFPTTRDHFRLGDEVAWVWGDSRRWGEAWYRDPESGAIHKAWEGSLEFIGTPIDDLGPGEAR
jgi:hypothetical protein